jgi:alpha-glucoside transport system permease protein
MDLGAKLGTMVMAIGGFAGLVAFILFVGSRFQGRNESRNVGLLLVAPALIGLAIAIVYPMLRTIVQSFFGDGANATYVGLDNYAKVLSDPDYLVVLRNTALWTTIAPLAASLIGLGYAALVDGTRFEALAKSLVFLPMAISLVGASIIWRFVYDYKPDQPGVEQTGLLNQVVVWFGGQPQQWLLFAPTNTLFLIVVMIWIQAGFAMTVLSAAIKGIPTDIVDAARIDGASGLRLFSTIVFPLIRSTFLVVLITIAIWTVKVFDIVRTMTGGQFGTSVLANEFYTQVFRVGDQGVGATLAVMLFALVLPLVGYNILRLREAALQ